MGVRVLYDRNEDAACLYDSVTGTAFGPVFDDIHDTEFVDAQDAAMDFLRWYDVRYGGEDPRRSSGRLLRQAFERWKEQVPREAS